MHIADLTAAIGQTDNSDVQFIYRQQLASSRNNLRALNQWITAYSGTYTPTYITQSSYNEIINSPWNRSRCNNTSFFKFRNFLHEPRIIS